jgi:hypothetical protein
LPAGHRYSLGFIVIGAQRCGTTTLFEHLRSHPELELPVSKEAPYFSHDRRFQRRWDDFAALVFPPARKDKIYGKITTHYMAGGTFEEDSAVSTAVPAVDVVPLRIASVFPKARLIAILRDPTARAISHCRMMIALGQETRELEAALRDSLQPEQLEAARDRPSETNGYVVWGEYARLLAGYLRHFPRDRLLILSTQRLQDEPRAVLREVLDFLRVWAGYLPPSLGETHRPAFSRRRTAFDLYGIQREASALTGARWAWHRLPLGARRHISRLYSAAAYRWDLYNRIPPTESTPDVSPALLERLAEHFEPQNRSLYELVGDVPGVTP